MEAVFDGGRLVDSCTNIWGVGFVIWSLIRLRECDPTLAYDLEAEDPASDNHEPRLTNAARQVYSSELLDLMSQCLCYNPGERIQFPALLDAIRARSVPSPLRTAARDDPGFLAGMFRRAHPAYVDKFTGESISTLDGTGSGGGANDEPGGETGAELYEVEDDDDDDGNDEKDKGDDGGEGDGADDVIEDHKETPEPEKKRPRKNLKSLKHLRTSVKVIRRSAAERP